MNTKSEPVRLIALLNTAIVVTVNLFALILGWSEGLVTALNIVIAAWIAFGGELVRMRVAPVKTE